MQIRLLSSCERLDWLRLSRTENIGPVGFFTLLKLYNTADAALQALPEWAKRSKRFKPLRIMSVDQAKREVQAHSDIGSKLVAFCEPDYPPLLRHIEDPPPILSILGHPILLHQGKTVAIVGTRNATLNARRFTYQLAHELSNLGYTIVSGMARGIDGCAHEGSLINGTVAVLAGGIDIVYPPGHQELYEKIHQTGVILSEQPLSMRLMPTHFPRRNRLISGISHGVIVVEAPTKSGALITARCGLDQGREVFAVPGSPLDPRAKGTNRLIQQGATLIQSAMDVHNVLSMMPQQIAAASELPPVVKKLDMTVDLRQMDEVRHYLTQSLSVEPVLVDALIRDSQFPAALISAALLEMEIGGRLKRFPGNKVSLLMEIDVKN